MYRKFVNARSPLRLLEKGLQGGLGIGNIGVLVAGHGVGKTPFLVGVALDELLRQGTVLHVAHRAMESITMDREVMHERDRMAPRFAELIYNGFWFAPEMDYMRAAIEASQENVTGEVRVKLYKGNVTVEGRRSPLSLYSEDLVTFEEDEGAYDQRDATGFIRLQGLRLARNEK